MPLRELTGHRRILDLLTRSISRGALPPSLIFAGPAGVGKRRTALAVAQALNCLNPVDGDACGTCAQCVRIARGVHPDVLVVEPGDSGTIKIDQVRDIVDRSAYRPFEGRRRVVIVDDADMLVTAAQNALLKTLEEPAASSVFILATTRPDVLLPTVRSRCIQLTFSQTGREAVDPDASRVAQRVLAHAAADNGQAARRLDAAKDLLTGTGGGAAADREQVASHLNAMASLLRDMAIVSTRAGAPLANEELAQTIERLAPAYQGSRGVRAFAAIDQALEAIDRNVGVKVVADWLVLQL